MRVKKILTLLAIAILPLLLLTGCQSNTQVSKNTNTTPQLMEHGNINTNTSPVTIENASEDEELIKILDELEKD